MTSKNAKFMLFPQPLEGRKMGRMAKFFWMFKSSPSKLTYQVPVLTGNPPLSQNKIPW